jgi:hypothetical protein
VRPITVARLDPIAESAPRFAAVRSRGNPGSNGGGSQERHEGLVAGDPVQEGLLRLVALVHGHEVPDRDRRREVRRPPV